ncbi:MAG: hypothetical protein K0R57_3257 [Paenibacillaceae bacterium]|jgi:hypothetical protein|nr:hypothetical protein [Paenibacillaceae bacterium]
MTWWGWLLLAFIVVLSAAALSSIQMQVFYSRMKDNDRFYFYIEALYGLIKYRYEVPLLAFKGLFKGVEVKQEYVNEQGDRLVGEKTSSIDKDKILEFFRKAKQATQSTFHIKDWVLDMMTRVTCTKLSWNTRIGLGDAPETAIVTGVIWSLKSSALGYLFRHVKRCATPKIQVLPMYNQIHFSTEFSCIAQIRLGHAIFVGLLFLIRILKVKGGIKAWQSILFKAS